MSRHFYRKVKVKKTVPPNKTEVKEVQRNLRHFPLFTTTNPPLPEAAEHDLALRRHSFEYSFPSEPQTVAGL